MVHIIFLVILAACHNPSLQSEICNTKLDLGARPYARKKNHPDPPWILPKLSTAASLNISMRLTDPSWANPAGASVSISKSATRLPPKTTPSALPFYSGKRATLSTKKQRVTPLQRGGVFWSSGKTSVKEINDLPTKPQPPPAPNIDLLTKAPPDTPPA
jgi:hypothetical protein